MSTNHKDMRLGIDFDNTIVTYDSVFHKYAVKQGLVPAALKADKKEIRDFVRLLPGGEDKWIELQALVYGLKMDEAELASGVERVLIACREKSINVSVISHKTVYPARGPQVNLREAARKWLKDRSFYSEFGLSPSDVVFVGTVDEKTAEIAGCGCTHFVDDLLEFLLNPGFPRNTKRILYAKDGGSQVPEGILRFGSWTDIYDHLFGR